MFLWINGHDLDAPEDDAFDLMIALADGSLADVDKIAERLAATPICLHVGVAAACVHRKRRVGT